MKKNSGLAAGILAVLALVGVSNLPNRNSGAPATAEQKKPAVPSGRAPAHSIPHPYSPCTEIVKRVRRLVAGAKGPVESWALPESCYEAGSAQGKEVIKTPGAVRFAIATVPDPVTTHLTLMFDRLVESIQQAAQDENYSYDASWFPWDQSEENYALLPDQRAADDLREIQQSHPGVIVFRNAVMDTSAKPYDGGLIVFVVGEQPTGGISDDQFSNALAWITRMGGLPGALRILGPTFSGSLPSLKRALEPGVKGYSELSVLSGSVSSAVGFQWFNDWIKNVPKSKFRTTIESDSRMADRFCRYLKDQGYPIHQVAFLSEDETAFGGSLVPATSPCYEATSFYYPRDIATLRSAYQRQSILSPSQPEARSNAPSTTLRGDLSEPSSNEHDTMRNYGGQLTPLAQESILLNIVTRLSDKHSQFVVIRSTNTLDQIFLSQFLRRAYPEGRVVIDGADLLFNRGAEGKSLRGVMLLSTYPLFAAEQEWTAPVPNKPSSTFRVYGEDISEGVYVAARELLRNPSDKSMVPIFDYSAPAWAAASKDDPAEDQRPSTWLTVISRRTFWPLAALNANTLKPGRPHAGVEALRGTLPTSNEREDGDKIGRGDPHPLYLPPLTWMFVLICVFGSAVHFYFCSNGSIMAFPRARTYFAPIPRWEHSFLIAMGSLVVAMGGVAVSTGLGLVAWIEGNHPFRDGVTGILLLLAIVFMLSAALLGCRNNFRTPAVLGSGSSAKNSTRWQRGAVLAAVTCFAAFIGIQLYLARNLTRANLIPAYWRSINLTSGVSGLIPEVLLLAGMYIWFWFNLHGLAHFGDDRPRLPKLDDLPRLGDTPVMPMFSDECAGVPVEDAARPLWRFKLLVAAFAAAFLVSCLALQDFGLQTLGERQFGIVILLWVSLIIAVILIDCVQMWRVWKELRTLLVYLDRLPLRRTLRALKGLAWGSIWKMSGNVLDERYRVITFQLESLRHLRNTFSALSFATPAQRENRTALLMKLDKCQQKSQDFAKWFVTLKKGQRVDAIKQLSDFQLELASTAAAVMNRVLLPEWRTETDSLIFGRGREASQQSNEESSETDIPADGMPAHVRAAEEFFVLPYLAFIQNILGRVRTIALSGLWLFVVATLAVSSYPFEPETVLGAIFLGVFVIVGGILILVHTEMARDATLSHITNTQPGQLGWEFWLRLVAFGIGPLLGLLTTLFPSLTDFVFSWLQPSVEALK